MNIDMQEIKYRFTREHKNLLLYMWGDDNFRFNYLSPAERYMIGRNLNSDGTSVDHNGYSERERERFNSARDKWVVYKSKQI